MPALQIFPRETTKYKWYKDGNLLPESNRIQIAENGDLYFSHMKSQDRGTYKLTVENTFMLSKGKQYAKQDIVEFQMTITGLISCPKFLIFLGGFWRILRNGFFTEIHILFSK